MLDLKLDFDGGLFLRARKTFSCRRVPLLDSMLDFLASKSQTETRFLPKTNILSKFFTLKCWTRSCTLPTGNVECTRKSRPPQQFSDARLDARLFSLEKSDGNSVFAKNRLFARVFNLKKSDVKSSIEKGTIKKCFRAVTRNPPPSQDKKSCLILRQPLIK